jgi:hypothetical protein
MHQAVNNTPSSNVYHFCTYFDRNYLTRGLALYESLRRHCRRPFILWILCFDDETYDTLSRLNLPGVRLITQQEFEAGDEALARAKADRSRVEYYWTCTPSLPLYVLRHNPQVDIITYLDADLYFYNDPQPIYDELKDGSVLIVEHRFPPKYEHLVSVYGIYNVSLLTFRQDNNGIECLQWWRERCLEWCHTDSNNGKFGDQKYLDDWLKRFRGVVVLQHKGAGLAPWNIFGHKVECGKISIIVDGAPLIFYHFHGYKHLMMPVVYSDPVPPDQLRYLYFPYAVALEKARMQVASLRQESVTSVVSFFAPDIVRGLLTQSLLRILPWFLSHMLWLITNWRWSTRIRIEAGFVSYARDDLPAARSNFLAAALRNPFVLSNRGILSILLESLTGPVFIQNIRRRWHGLLKNQRN